MGLWNLLNPFKAADEIAKWGNTVDNYVPTFSKVVEGGDMIRKSLFEKGWMAAVNAVTGKDDGQQVASADNGEPQVPTGIPTKPSQGPWIT